MNHLVHYIQMQRSKRKPFSFSAIRVNKGAFYNLGLLLLLVSLCQVAAKAAPGNDDFANSTPIFNNTGTTTGTNNVGSTLESGEPTPSSWDVNGRTVWYRWTAPATGGATFTTSGSDFNNTIGVYTGSAVNNLADVVQFRGGEGTHSCFVAFHARIGITYNIQVTDWDGATGNITLNWRRGPVNDDFSNAQVLTGTSVSTTGTNVGSTLESGEPTPSSWDVNGRTVWYRWTAPATGGATFTTSGSDFNNTIGVYTGSAVNNLADAVQFRGGEGTHSCTVTFHATIAVTYNIQITDWDGNDGNIVLYGGQSPSNDNFSNAQPIAGDSGVAHGINLPASSESGEPLHAGVQGGSSVWFQWTPTASGNVTFTTDGSDFDTLLAVYTGSAINSLTAIASDDQYPGSVNGSSRVTFSVHAGTTYHIAVDGRGGLTGHYTLSWSGNTHLLWTNTNGAMSLWTVDSAGNWTGQSYGPYPGLTAAGIADGPDGATHILWTGSDGRCALWTIDSMGHITGKTYGPYDGWTAKGISVGPDNRTRLLWSHTTGLISLWSVGGDFNYTGQAYGPYGAFTGNAVSVGPDNKTRILGNNPDGSAAIWNVDTIGNISGRVYGPYSGWHATTIASGADNNLRILWNYQDGTIGVWNVTPAGTITANSYGPYSGWSASALSVGGDNTVHIAWTKSDGTLSLGATDITGNTTHSVFGPYAGWSAIGVASGL